MLASVFLPAGDLVVASAHYGADPLAALCYGIWTIFRIERWRCDRYTISRYHTHLCQVCFSGAQR